MKANISERKELQRIVGILLGIMVFLAMLPFGTQIANAEAQADVSAGGISFHLWYGSTGASVAVRKYSGTETNVKIPKSVTYNGKTYTDGSNGFFFIEKGAFSGNTKITQIAIPDNCEAINEGAFTGCTNLKTYYIKGAAIYQDSIINSGIGTDANGKPIAGVIVWTKKGSAVDNEIQELNKSRPEDKQIILKYEDNPYNKSNGASGGGSNTPAPTNNESTTPSNKEPSNPYSKGASEKAITKAITTSNNDGDPKGTTFYMLQAKAKGATKTSVTLGWTKVKGAKKYVVYGNMCNVGKKKYKYVKLCTTTGVSKKFTKIKKTKVKNGTYYKFKVVALNKNNKVIATSKTIHVATPGGKVGNDKAVTTAAKKNKVSIKKNKTFKLKAKATPANKKLKVKRHRKIAYESSNPAVATVSAKGVIKGKKKGTCNVFAYAQNGVFKKIKVTVK